MTLSRGMLNVLALQRSSHRDPVTLTQTLAHHSPVEGKCVVEADIVLLGHVTGGQGLQRLHQLDDG